MRQFWAEEYDRWEGETRVHHGGVFNTQHLLEIERWLPQGVSASAETGCGKTTIILSNISENHHFFALDDRNAGVDSSILFFENCPITRRESIRYHLGATQEILRNYKHDGQYDIVLIDGPHGHPFPELEYYFFYPHIRTNGLLILDDVHIPTIGRLADVLAEDEMFELLTIVRTTAILRRTTAETFDPVGDGWWTQRYNRRRVSTRRDFFLPSESVTDIVSSQKLDMMLHGEPLAMSERELLVEIERKFRALDLAYQESLQELSESRKNQEALTNAKAAADEELVEIRAAIEVLRKRQNSWRGVLNLLARKVQGWRN